MSDHTINGKGFAPSLNGDHSTLSFAAEAKAFWLRNAGFAAEAVDALQTACKEMERSHIDLEASLEGMARVVGVVGFKPGFGRYLPEW